VEIPVDRPFSAELTIPEKPSKEPSPEERLAAFDRLMARAVRGANIPDEALRREAMYDEER
jgi:hypothetical protein